MKIKSTNLNALQAITTGKGLGTRNCIVRKYKACPPPRPHPYLNEPDGLLLVHVVQGLTGHHIRSAAVHLQRTHRRHNHRTLRKKERNIGYVGGGEQCCVYTGRQTNQPNLRSESGVAALDIKEFLHADVRTKASLRHTKPIL